MADKIVVEDLYKVFGPHPGRAMRLLEEGRTKQEIFRRTGATVGVQAAGFTVREGEIFVVMGLSGSGKSTLVRMLNRLIEPTAGRVFIDGQDVTAMNRGDLIRLRRESLSMVFQSFALLPHRTVLDNAAFGLEVAGVARAERHARALEALESVGLRANADSYPDELSGGMQQRVGLCRALASDPDVMLMDEAFSALDPLIRTEMQDELLRLQQEHARTVVFISHDLDEAIRIGDRIAIMEDGRIVQIGTPEEIVSTPANDYVRSFFHGVDVSQVFTTGDVASRGLVTVVERQGVDLASVLERLRGHESDYAVVIDRQRRYRGMISVGSLQRAVAAGGDDRWRRALLAEAEPVAAERSLGEVLNTVADTPWPVPVVDGDGRYVGCLSRALLLRTLDKAG